MKEELDEILKERYYEMSRIALHAWLVKNPRAQIVIEREGLMGQILDLYVSGITLGAELLLKGVSKDGENIN